MPSIKARGRTFHVNNTTKAQYDALVAKRGGTHIFLEAADIFGRDRTIDHSKFQNDDHRVMYITRIAEGMQECFDIIKKNVGEWTEIEMQETNSDFATPDYLERNNRSADEAIREVEG